MAAVAVASAEGYEAAFAEMAKTEDVALVICDSTDAAVQKKLRSSVEEASGQRRERLCVVAGAKNETVEQLIARANL